MPGLIAKESELQRLDMVVIDEAQHLFKTADNRRELCKLASRLADRRVVLTATPIYRSVLDLDVLHALTRPHGKTDWDRQTALEEQRRIMSLVKDVDGRRPQENGLLEILGIEGIDTSGQLTVEAAKLMLMDKAPLSQWMVKTRSQQVGQLSSRQPILRATTARG